MKRNLAIILAVIISIGSVSNVCFADGVDNPTDITALHQSADEDSHVVAKSPVSILSNGENFEEMEATTSEESISKEFDTENYYIAETNKLVGASVCIDEEEGNKFLHLNKDMNSRYAGYSFKYAVTPNIKANVSYRIRFNEPCSSNYMAMPLSGDGGVISTTYLSDKKFGLNFSGNTEAANEWGVTKEISGGITLGIWYTLRYEIDCNTKTYNLNITDENDNIITSLSNVPFRGNATKFSSLQIDSPSDVSGGSSVDIDEVSVSAWSQEAVYYSVKGPETLDKGINYIDIDITNLSGEQKNIGVYLRIYADEQFLRYEKMSFNIANGRNISLTERIDTSEYYEDGVKYTCDALVLGNDGENYGVISKSALSGTDSIAMNVKADYKINGLKLTCTTEYDNSTVMVFAPGCELQEALNSPNGKLIYAETVNDSGINMSLPIPDEYGEGQYMVVILSLNADRKIAQKSVSAYYCGSLIVKEMLSDFNGAQEDTIVSVVNKYMSTHPTLASFDENVKDFYEQNQTAINTSILKGKPYTSVNGIIEILNTVYSISTMVKAETVEEFTSLLENYADLFGIDLTEEEYVKHKLLINSRLYNEVHNNTGITANDIVTKFNDILSEAGNMNTVVIAKSPADIVSRTVDFENMEISEPGKSVSEEFDDKNYYKAEAAPTETTVHIAEEAGNKYLNLNKNPNSGYASYSFNYSITPSEKAEVSYRIRFNEPCSSNYMAMPLSGDGEVISTTYLSNKKFGLNFSGNTEAENEWGVTKEISGGITLGIWYTLRYEIDCDTKTYNLNITDENGKVITNLSNVPFRNAPANFSSLNITSPSDTSGGSNIDIDDISLSSREQDTVYYNITGPEAIEKGSNEIGVKLNNLSGEQKNVGVYLRIFADGQFLRYEKFSFDVANGETISVTKNIDTSAYYKNGVKYTCDALVLGNDGENYGVMSKSALSGADGIVPSVKADYGINGLKLNLTTEYDNSTVMVLAPGCELHEALDEPNGRLIHADTVTDSDAAMDIPIPDEFGEGQYTVVITSVNKQREMVKKSVSVYYCGSQIAKTMLSDFNNAQESTITSVVNKYINTHPVLLSLGENIKDFYEQNQAMVNAAFLEEKPYTSVTDIVENLNSVFCIYSMINAETVEEFTCLLEGYADLFEIDVTKAEYLTHKTMITARLYDKIHNKEGIIRSDVKNEFYNSMMIAEFNTADRLTIESILTKYASALGIDVSNTSYKSNKSKINKEMTSNGIVYNEPEDISQKYKELINSLPTQGSSGSIGGGGGATKVTSTSNLPIVSNLTDKNSTVQERRFVDIDDVPWAEESIMRLKKAGVINGVDNESFNPHGYVTREAFAKMIAIAFNVSGDKKSFNDVADDEWYAPYVSVLAGAGILSGIGDGVFGIGQNLTRQDAAVILERAAKYSGYEFQYNVSALNIFQDEIADYAIESVQKLYQSGVINGISEKEFGGYQGLTRAQAAKLIDGLMQIQ